MLWGSEKLKGYLWNPTDIRTSLPEIDVMFLSFNNVDSTSRRRDRSEADRVYDRAYVPFEAYVGFLFVIYLWLSQTMNTCITCVSQEVINLIEVLLVRSIMINVCMIVSFRILHSSSPLPANVGFSFERQFQRCNEKSRCLPFNHTFIAHGMIRLSISKKRDYRGKFIGDHQGWRSDWFCAPLHLTKQNNSGNR